MPSFEIALLELKRLFRSRPVRLAAGVICLVPLLYGVLYLWAFWNPYQRLDKQPVALVDNDVAVQVNGVQTHAGTDLVRSLLKSKTYGWQVVSAAEAARGVANGRYYMALTIPPDFSRRLAQADSTDAVRATLRVDSNEGSNLLATQIGSRIFLEIRDSVAAQASASYYRHVFVILGTVHDQLDKAGAGSSQVSRALGRARNGAQSVSGGTASAAAGSQRLVVGLGKLVGGSAQLSSGTKQIAGGAKRLASGLTAAAGGAAGVAGGSQRLSASSQTLAGGVAHLSSSAAQLASSGSQLAAGVAQASDGIEQADAQLSSAAGSAAQVAAAAAQVSALLSAYAAGHADAAADAGFQQALAAAAQVAGGAQSVSSGLSAAAPQLQRLRAGVTQLDAGAQALKAGLSTYSVAAAQAASGALSLAGGAASLSAGAAHLGTGLATAKQGAARLAAAGAAVAHGAAAVTTGSRSAAAGASSLSSGLRKLSSGSLSLLSGLGSIGSGSTRLTTALRAGASQVPAVTASSAVTRAAVMSAPVRLKTTRVDPVPNYGTGFAPYFIPLALWVGALMTYFLIRAVNGRALASTLGSTRVALAGLWPAAALTALQAIILLLVLQLCLGLHPTSVVALYLFTLVTAFSFAAIMQLLSAALGTAGKFVAVVLLMLQLTSSAGTFPLQTVPRFFQIINPFLPMTYVVRGLRQAISIGSASAILVDAGVLLGFAALAIGCTILTVRRRRLWTMDRLYPALTL